MDKATRDQLILKYAPLVKYTVGRITAKLPIPPADREDLVHVGIIGLISALEKFDPSRNVQFETYARFRIRGAVLDELRARDWVPRSVRNKDDRIEEAFTRLRKDLGRPPGDGEVADCLGVSVEEYYKMLDEAKFVTIVSAEDLPPDFLEHFSRQDVMEEVDRGNPLQLLANGELRERLKEAIDDLPDKERLVLSLYYYEELTMKEIGKVLKLTESRVCQLHSQATLRLRGAVKDLR
ncbi:MAG: RNA polymerase sigma factor FliA [Syntrophaceae bacterium PtaU1.Bin231]|nr:MAG: RNA polymerase sigma factor FliA [Syntrophaceae bacterium PtaU1.Bin231]HOG16762.1 FliA/WhiG family RNA polymerase sigma factor [Syntrophales bacterium]